MLLEVLNIAQRAQTQNRWLAHWGSIAKPIQLLAPQPIGSIKDLTGEIVRPTPDLTGLGEGELTKPAGDDRIQAVDRSSRAYTFVLA
jgi:hypothetical protein